MTNVKKLNPPTQRNTVEIVLGKLNDLAAEGRLAKLLVVAWGKDEEGVSAEYLFGTETLDRYDFLAAKQATGHYADLWYKDMLYRGFEALDGEE